jgi:hypothetical protein
MRAEPVSVNLTGIAVNLFLGVFVSVILFQFVYMMISPQRWVRSRFALKAGNMTEQVVDTRFGRIYYRIIGFIGTCFLSLYIYISRYPGR